MTRWIMTVPFDIADGDKKNITFLYVKNSFWLANCQNVFFFDSVSSNTLHNFRDGNILLQEDS